MKYVLALALLFNLCCGYESSRRVSAVRHTNSAVDIAPSQASTPVSSNEQGSPIRDLDFSNFTYPWYPRWEYMLSQKIEFSLRDGRIDVDVPYGSNEPSAFELANILYGDVTGDSEEEAIITIKMDVAGNSMPYALFVFTLMDRKPKMLWVHEAGDRGDGGLRNVYITGDHLLAVEQYNSDKLMAGGGEAMAVGICCPKKFRRTFYKWNKRRFQKFREETHPNDYKDARVLVGSSNGKRHPDN